MLLIAPTLRSLPAKARRAAAASHPHQLRRCISVGTDLTSSKVTLQKARPWYDDDESGSNLAKDNEVSMTDLFKGRKVALFGVPAPFTGVCTHAHVPPYKALVDEFKKKGVDTVVCYSVTDPYAHYNWAEGMEVDTDRITFLADVDCEFAKEHDLDRDYAGASLGHRSARFSMIVEDGKVKVFNEVEDAEKDAETLLGQI